MPHCSIYDTIALFMITPAKKPQRTIPQNNSIHLWCAMVAEQLNDAGLEIPYVLQNSVSVPWSTVRVKELLWRPIQNMQVSKKSTTELDTSEVSKIYDTLNRFLSEEHGLHVPFPSVDNSINYDHKTN